MKTIKRILALIPAILVLIWCVVPLGSMAVDDPSDEYYPSQDNSFPTYDYIYSTFPYNRSSNYLLLHYRTNPYFIESSNTITFSTHSLYFPLDGLNYSENSGVYTFSGLSSSKFYVHTFQGYYSYVYDSSPNTVFENSSLHKDYKDFTTNLVFDLNKKDVFFNDTCGANYHAQIGTYLPYSYEFILDGNSISLNEIEVDTFPKLEGDTSLNIYQLDDEGYKVSDSSNTYLSLQTFQIDITNNTDKAFQYACYIMPKGESLTYHSNYSDILGSRFFSNNPTFIYITDEIFYNYLGNDNPTSPAYNNQYRTVYAPSSWHLIEAGASESVYIGENQLQLKKDIEYDIVILGVFTEYGEIIDGTLNNGSSSLNSIVTGIDPYVTFYSDYEVKEYYRSTFTLDKDTSYCNTQYSDDGSFDMVNTHVYPYNPNTSNDEVFNTIYGQTFEGETSYHNNVFNPNYNGAHVDYPGSNPGINNNFGSGVSLTSGFNSFFGMITDLLKHLPGPFLNIFIFGFSSIVVIAIIKAVKS